MRQGTVAVGYVRALVEFAVSRGADRVALLAAAGIGADVLADHDARLPFGTYVAAMRAGQALTGDPALALRHGAAVELAAFSVTGLLALASRDMDEALEQLNRYGALVVEVPGLAGRPRFEVVDEGDGRWLVDHRGEPDRFPELTESTFARMICGPRAFAPALRAHAVEVTHPAPAHAGVYEEVLQCPVTFGAARNAIRIDHSWGSHPVAVSPRYVFGVLAAHAETLLARLSDADSVRGTVERLLLPDLHTGAVGVDAVARQMGISRQTLFRRLKAEGTSFAAVLDGVRQRLAMDYLAAGKVSVNETAYLVGFADPAAFSRAFKRWTGHSPATWCRQRREPGVQ
jgi:AraC-like DNA-binding protein